MRKFRAASLLAAAALGLACSTAPTTAAADTADHVRWTNLGGVSMHGYCVAKGFVGTTFKETGGMHLWYCVGTEGEELINLYRVCSWQYQRVVVLPKYDPQQPYSLVCYGLTPS